MKNFSNEHKRKSGKIIPHKNKDLINGSSNLTRRGVELADILFDEGDVTISIKARHKYSGHSNSISCVCFSPSGAQIASGSFDKTIRLWEVETRKLIAVVDKNISRIKTIAFSPDGQFFLAGCLNNEIHAWYIKRKTLLIFLGILGVVGHSHSVTRISFVPNSNKFLSTGLNGNIILWEININKIPVSEITQVYERNWMEEYWHILSVSDISTNRLIASRKARIISLSISPSGKQIAIGGKGWIELIDFPSQQEKEYTKIFETTGDIIDITFSPDGRNILSGSSKGHLTFWDARTGNHEIFDGHTDRSINAVAISPDGRLAISGGEDLENQNEGGFGGTIRIWEMKTGRLLKNISYHDKAITSLCFSPDGKKILSGSHDKTVGLCYIEY